MDDSTTEAIEASALADDELLASAAAAGCPHARGAERPRYPFHRPDAETLPPVYAELRATCPVVEVTLPTGDPGYIVSRYADTKFVLGDARFSRAAMIEPDVPQLMPVPMPPGSLFSTDAPEHTRLRKLVLKQFTARRVRELEPRIQELTTELLDAMADSSERRGDLNSLLAFPLPVAVICELLGVPFADRESFRGWSDAFVSLTSHTPEEMATRRQSMIAYLMQLIESKRTDPGTDLMSALVHAHDEDGSLSQQELVIMGITLLVAGHETTVGMIGTCVLTLLQHPEHIAYLREHPEQLEATIEELLRVNPIGDGGPLRITLEDVEIAGTVIPARSAVMAAICSGSRDESVFDNGTGPGNVDRFDPFRPNAKDHLAFGSGPHHCLGAPLARAELRIVIGSLLERFPDLRLDVPASDLAMTSGMMVHGLTGLPVAW